MESLFRTRAWTQSWLNVWGKHPRIQLIDLGGRGDPLEMLYTIRHHLKKIIPVKSLVSVGYGFADFDPPRAEYNNLNSLISLTGGVAPLMKELKNLSWDQFALPDLCNNSSTVESQDLLLGDVIKLKSDVAYRVRPGNFAHYKCQLDAATRAKYFNRRARLATLGSAEFCDFENSQECFQVLNTFHLSRWGRPCYSPTSIAFFSEFNERIKQESGRPFMQCIKIDGEIVSVLFDVFWQGVRYNLQSGYAEGRFGSLSLGSLQLGFAIEQALTNGHAYDFLAGNGKHTNYKEKIANHVIEMGTYCIARGWLKHLYKLYGK